MSFPRERDAGRQVLLSTPWCSFVEERASDGSPYYLLDVPDYVAVVAQTSDGRVVLVRQHRQVTGRPSTELPSGCVEPGENPELAARRELVEETGIVAGTMELLGTVVPDIGRLSNRMWCYYAADVTVSPGYVDDKEGITCIDVPRAEALAMALDGRIEHALHLSALFLAVGKGKLSFR